MTTGPTMSAKSDDEKWRRYDAALRLLSSSENLLWLVWGGFAIPSTILLGALAKGALEGDIQSGQGIGYLVASGLGFVFFWPWLAAYSRNARLWRLRMAQARECEPPRWELLAGRGQRFAKGGGDGCRGRKASAAVARSLYPDSSWNPIRHVCVSDRVPHNLHIVASRRGVCSYH